MSRSAEADRHDGALCIFIRRGGQILKFSNSQIAHPTPLTPPPKLVYPYHTTCCGADFDAGDAGVECGECGVLLEYSNRLSDCFIFLARSFDATSQKMAEKSSFLDEAYPLIGKILGMLVRSLVGD